VPVPVYSAGNGYLVTAMLKRPREMENVLFGPADIEGIDRKEKAEWPFVLC
jgi:hypothetical protein